MFPRPPSSIIPFRKLTPTNATSVRITLPRLASTASTLDNICPGITLRAYSPCPVSSLLIAFGLINTTSLSQRTLFLIRTKLHTSPLSLKDILQTKISFWLSVRPWALLIHITIRHYYSYSMSLSYNSCIFPIWFLVHSYTYLLFPNVLLINKLICTVCLII